MPIAFEVGLGPGNFVLDGDPALPSRGTAPPPKKKTEKLNLTNKKLLGLFICVCIVLSTSVAHNTAQNKSDNLLSYPSDNHHCSDDVYLREGGQKW